MTEHDRDILSRTIYGEARGEPEEGKIAVGRVIINRWKSGKWFAGKTIAETCQKPWQFSCWNQNDPNRVKLLEVKTDNALLMKCAAAADAAEKNEGAEWLTGCTHYHTVDVKPKWAEGKEPVGKIGSHLFYRNIN